MGLGNVRGDGADHQRASAVWKRSRSLKRDVANVVYRAASSWCTPKRASGRSGCMMNEAVRGLDTGVQLQTAVRTRTFVSKI